MKALSILFKSLSILTVLIAPSTLVEGKNEISLVTNSKSTVYSTFNSSDAIKKFIGYTIVATSVYQSDEVAGLAKQVAAKVELKKIGNTATSIYDEMNLGDSGLSRQAFECAWTGYYKLQKKGLLHKTGILSICDFSQSSSQERMYVIDVRHRKMLYRTFVAHGINSGEEYASAFSNSDESCKSSLGFYVTSSTYYGGNGLSLRIEGVDKGFNDHASRRNIVIHGAPYVSLRILHKYGVMGTTFGCPAIPSEMISQIIPVVKNGSCFFIYYPSNKYITQSTVLNS